MHFEGPGGRTAVLLAAAGWLRVQYDLLGGFGHDLNGRASSLDGLLQILQMQGTEKTPVGTYLAEEVARLTELAGTLRSLSGDVEAAPEPLLAHDVTEQAAALLRRHRRLESVHAEVVPGEDVPPVRANAAVLLRVLLILLSAAALEATARDLPRVILAVHTDGETVRFEISLGGALPPWDTAVLADRTQLLSELLEDVGGSVTLEPEGVAVVTLPPMTRGQLPSEEDGSAPAN